MQDTCTHHWVIGNRPVRDSTFSGKCKHCGAERTFNSEETVFSKKRFGKYKESDKAG